MLVSPCGSCVSTRLVDTSGRASAVPRRRISDFGGAGQAHAIHAARRPAGLPGANKPQRLTVREYRAVGSFFASSAAPDEGRSVEPLTIQNRIDLAEVPPGILNVAGGGFQFRSLPAEVSIEAEHKEFADVLGGHRSEGDGQVRPVRFTLKTHRELPAAPIEPITADLRLFREDRQVSIRPGDLQILPVVRAATVTIKNHPRMSIRPLPPDAVDQAQRGHEIDARLAVGPGDLRVERAGVDRFAGHAGKLDAGFCQIAREPADHDAKFIGVVGEGQGGTGSVPGRLGTIHVEKRKEVRVLLRQPPAEMPEKSQHAPFEMFERMGLAGPGELEILGIVHRQALAAIAFGAADRFLEPLPEIRRAAGRIVIRQDEDRRAETERPEHGAVSGFIDSRVDQHHRHGNRPGPGPTITAMPGTHSFPTKAPTKEKVLVAMSGGVDSSVAAALLKEQGYDVVGCFMRLGSPGETLDELAPFEEEQMACDPKKIRIGKQGCCSINDAADARIVAAKLDIPFYVCNFKKDFGRIIDYFVGEYNAGRTPNPCVRCNDWLKFGKLHEYARQIDASFVASGHYARVERSNGSGWSLRRGVDHEKDQSYVLFGAPRDRLAEMMLPIGGFQKSEVRAMAERYGLPVFNKPDSQEICFVPDQDYAGLVSRRSPGAVKPGRIVDTGGKDLGEHPGQQHFTVGQRRGVGVALGYPIYVVHKDPASNTVVVGEREELKATGLRARETNWLVDGPARPGGSDPGWRACTAKIRYNADPVPARVRISGADELEVAFDEPQYAVAPGQAVVCYEGETVLGGGWIAEAIDR